MGPPPGLWQKIGEVLSQSGLQVDVSPVKSAGDLHSYDAVIMGSAAYMFQWRPDAVAFLKKNQKLLAEKPTWLFYSGVRWVKVMRWN